MRVTELAKAMDRSSELFGLGRVLRPGSEGATVPVEPLFGLGQEAPAGGGTPVNMRPKPTFGEVLLALGLVASAVFVTQVAMGFGTQLAPINIRLRGGRAGSLAGLGRHRRRR